MGVLDSDDGVAVLEFVVVGVEDRERLSEACILPPEFERALLGCEFGVAGRDRATKFRMYMRGCGIDTFTVFLFTRASRTDVAIDTATTAGALFSCAACSAFESFLLGASQLSLTFQLDADS